MKTRSTFAVVITAVIGLLLLSGCSNLIKKPEKPPTGIAFFYNKSELIDQGGRKMEKEEKVLSDRLVGINYFDFGPEFPAIAEEALLGRGIPFDTFMRESGKSFPPLAKSLKPALDDRSLYFIGWGFLSGQYRLDDPYFLNVTFEAGFYRSGDDDPYWKKKYIYTFSGSKKGKKMDADFARDVTARITKDLEADGLLPPKQAAGEKEEKPKAEGSDATPSK